MSARATVELDFLGLGRDSSKSSSSNKSQFQKFLHRQRSFRGIQSAISKMNPEMLKSVIASSVPSSPNNDNNNGSLLTELPLFASNNGSVDLNNNGTTTPLTIFYNGSVSVFNVPRDKAETILKIAIQGGSASASANKDHHHQTDSLNVNGDLPIARRKSLQRFLEKRKERLTSVSPFGFSEN